MNGDSWRRVAAWTARVGAIATVLFISIFALDVFSQPNWPLALLIHLLPSVLLAIVTVVAWRHGRVGGLVFIVLGLGTMLVTQLEGVIIYIPAIVLGCLFLAGEVGRPHKE